MTALRVSILSQKDSRLSRPAAAAAASTAAPAGAPTAAPIAAAATADPTASWDPAFLRLFSCLPFSFSKVLGEEERWLLTQTGWRVMTDCITPQEKESGDRFEN